MIYFPIKYNTNLGNWMFQYAAALKLGQPIGVILEKDRAEEQLTDYEDLFSGLRLFKPSDVIGVPVYHELAFSYTPLPAFSTDMVLDGFFQSEKYFDRDDVRRCFGITEVREAFLRGKYGDWLERPNVTGISVRKGADYREQCYMHPFVGKKYFKDCIARLQECNDFIVCSDNLDWCKAWFPKAFSGKNFLFVENESVLNQLYIQTLCRNNILSNSSFSWWGGWLNAHSDKKVFAPSMWFGPFAHYQKINWKDLYADCMTVVMNRPTICEWVDMQWRCWLKISKIEYVKLRRWALGW